MSKQKYYSKDIVGYLHCKKCLQAHKKDCIAVGFTENREMVVHCEACGNEVWRGNPDAPELGENNICRCGKCKEELKSDS